MRNKAPGRLWNLHETLLVLKDPKCSKKLSPIIIAKFTLAVQTLTAAHSFIFITSYTLGAQMQLVEV